MSNIQDLKLDYDAIGELLKSDDMLDLCDSYAQDYKQAGDSLVEFIGFDRAHAHLYRGRKNDD